MSAQEDFSELERVNRDWELEAQRRAEAFDAGLLIAVPSERVHERVRRSLALKDGDSLDSVHERFLSYITARDCRIAYIYLVRFAERLRGYRCFPKDSRPKREFRYYRGEEQPFAFIVNRAHLLFYFRSASQGHHARNVDELRRCFGDAFVNVNDTGEITVRIENESMATKLMQLVFDAS